ncbi:TATA-binding related factor [Metschnikowia bicuspidata var. bicuspidata NRRL YB-4993]|uniref:Mediator of RNA polymerase II transcription subunit 20 n=1 Tax=Metschnikowia bicuspidata var. bicuspidata NRRL YB-4993 TaxID=869754 RepID=A0A1A0HJI4_9ASCO|nr:TATA-binding related factor [Metschnikowia bicuspidata var. bicuspidata NRRL YB-4993]OBA24170.1 TATA-binding related factor [Metschnikowia bicuspidata var. bicuspidata NRRL YB-4993]
MVSAVLLVHQATPQTILQFHDEMCNKLPALKGKWGFSFKVFRNNIYLVPPHLAASHETAPRNSYLYTWVPSYLHDACVTLVDKTSAAVFSHVIREELSLDHALAVPDRHLHEGATCGFNDLFDFLVGQRMQSLWTQRQAIRGDGGQIYELENGNLVIRTANVSLHGNFRGFLIQIEVDHTKLHTADRAQIFADLIAKYDIPKGSLCYLVMSEDRPDLYGDLVLQYAETLNF